MILAGRLCICTISEQKIKIKFTHIYRTCNFFFVIVLYSSSKVYPLAYLIYLYSLHNIYFPYSLPNTTINYFLFWINLSLCSILKITSGGTKWKLLKVTRIPLAGPVSDVNLKEIFFFCKETVLGALYSLFIVWLFSLIPVP